LFPLAGAVTHFADFQSGWEKIWDVIHHAFLPVTALTISHLGGTYLLGRNSMTTVLEKDYLRTAWAKGLPKKRVIFRHALKNALLPIVTRVFLSLGSLVGGAYSCRKCLFLSWFGNLDERICAGPRLSGHPGHFFGRDYLCFSSQLFCRCCLQKN